MTTLNATNPHYVRCIKPNNLKVPDIIDGAKVLEQLRSNGVLETVKLRKAGYAQKFLFKDFVNRYFLLGFDDDTNEGIQLVLECFDCFSEGSWILGKSKVFLTSEVFQLLEIERKDAISGLLVKLQASIRVFNAKRQAAQLRERQRVIKKKYKHGFGF